MCEATKEAAYLNSLLRELNIKMAGESVTLFNDNQSAHKLAVNPIFHRRTKHIDVKYHFIREALESKLIDLHYKSTEEMTADILTKPLGPTKHNFCCFKLGLSHT